MIAIASLLLVVAVSLLVTRIATVVLVATGMSRQAARFQARSALTGTGFTTREAEAVVSHPVRRRVVMLLMLLGNAGLVAAASSLVLGFRGGGTGQQWVRVLELVAGLMILIVVSRSAWVDSRLTSAIGRFVNRHTDRPGRGVGGLLQLSGSFAVKELGVGPDDWLAGHELAALGLRDEGVVVLGLTRSTGLFLGAPTGSTEVRPGDTLIVYGRAESLDELDDRRRGGPGDEDHRRAVTRQELHQLREEREDARAREVFQGNDAI